MSFMSYEEILKAVQDKDIKIYYRAVSYGGVGNLKILPLEQMKPVSLDEHPQDDDQAHIKEYFLNSLKDDSMYFHVGQAAQLEFTDRNKDEKKHLEKITKDGKSSYYIFNIEESGKLTLHPQESVIVGTNEYIELSGDIGASIYATVSKTNIGFSHISTIIDPKWEGFLQISITNLSRYSQTLHYLDEFCTVRFHRLSKTTAPDENYEKLASDENYEKLKRKPYFKNSWWNQDKRMLPRGDKYNAKSNRQREIASWLKETLFPLFWAVLGIVSIRAIAEIIFFVGALSNKISNLEEFRKELSTNSVSIAEIKKDVGNLDKQGLQKEISEVNLSVSKPNYIIYAHFKELSTRPMIFVEFEGLPRDQITYTIDYSQSSGSKYSKAEIKLLYTGNKSVKGNVKWLVVYVTETGK